MDPRLIQNQRCENCGQLKIECARNTWLRDTRLPVSLRGQPCSPIIPFLSTKQICDRRIWAMLNQTSPYPTPAIAICHR